jgi:transposase
MDKVKQYVGIDISKDTFDVYDTQNHHQQYSNSNDPTGFKLFIKRLDEESCCVMEATGSYHHRLAVYLFEHEIDVAIINPLVIKRYIQMKLHHTKTDKSDAQMICSYAHEQPLVLWQPEPTYISQCNMFQSAIILYFKQSTAIKNKLHSLASRGIKSGVLVRSLKRQLKQLNKEIEILEDELEELIKEYNQAMYSNLRSIPGIGKKTALLLIASTNGFESFENHRQVSAYFGLSPTERTSGTSIRGRSRISKAGNPKIRNNLFLCSFTAYKCNPQCQALYTRLVAKGKSKKLALIAVANKLLKQAFAIAKSGINYDPNYRSVLIN